MRSVLLAVAVVACAFAWGGEADGPRPKGSTAVGTACARRGSRVVIAIAKGATLRVGEELLVGRPELLVALNKGTERVEAWGRWRDAGRLRVRSLRGPRCAIAFIIDETPRTGVDGKPAANIRPGDIVLRTSGSR